MSVRLSKEATVAMWLRKNEAFTNKFVKEWVAEHPELLEESLTSLKPRPAFKNLAAKENFVKTTSSESASSQIALNQHRRESYSLLDLGDDPLYNALLKDIISTTFDLNGLTTKIAKNSLLLIKGAECSVFLVENNALVPRALNVVASSFTEGIRRDRLGKEIPFRFSFDQGIVGNVVKNGVAICTENALKHPNYDPDVDQVKSDCSFICMPIKAPDGHAVGAIQVCGSNKDSRFTTFDVEILEDYLKTVSVTIVNNTLYEKTLLKATKLENVLELTKSLFENTASLKSFAHKLLTLALQLIPCELCRVFVIDNEPPGACAVVAFKVAFEMEGSTCKEIENNNSREIVIYDEMPFLDMATSAAMTAVTVAADTGLQTFKEDWMTGDCILCIPMLDPNEQAIGVLQLFHKLSEEPFTDTDIEFFEMFAKFCGLGIHNVMTYERLLKTSEKNEATMDMLSYHTDASEEDVERLYFQSLPSLNDTKLGSYYFDDLSLDDDAVVMGAVKMFHELGLVDCFHINQKVLLRWVLTVRANYKHAVYHNWRHAFNVAQTLFTVITTGLMSDHLVPLEQFALMIAAFCHDLDHNETSNTLLSKIANPLTLLYSTSTVEHHHIDLCLKILNDKKCNILHSLSAVEYNAVIEVIEHAILSTDLALYLKRRDHFNELIFGRTFDWNNLCHTRLLRAMVMPACDISVTAKPWHIQKRVVEMIANQFFEQEDEESSDYQLTQAVDHYRELEICNMQLEIIDDIAAPLYQSLASLHGSFQPFLEQVLVNREEWEQRTKSATLTETKNAEQKKQSAKESSKQTKGCKKQLNKEKKALKKQAKKAKRNQKKVSKGKKSSSTEQGHAGPSHIDTGMSLESVSSSINSYNSPDDSQENVKVDSQTGEHTVKKCGKRKKCLFSPFSFLKRLLKVAPKEQ